ncbi:MAG: hypothetical protein ABJA82_00100 [Myxococcales bacterium]
MSDLRALTAHRKDSVAGDRWPHLEGGRPPARSWEKARAIALLYAVVLGVALILLMVTACYGHHPSDDGWLLAYGWRILHGEIPYRDFWWAQPPVTLYTASLWLLGPEGWQYKMARVAFYPELASVTLLPASWAMWTGRLRADVVTLAIIASCVALAFHNFPPMPWTTVDGLFFGACALGAFLASLERSSARAVWRSLSSLAASLALFSKQGFAPLPVVLAAYALWEFARERRLALLGASVLPGAAVTASILGWLYVHQALGPFVSSLRGSGSGAALVKAGVGAFLRPFPAGPVMYAAFAFLGFRLAGGRGVEPSSFERRFHPTMLAFSLSLAVLGVAMNRQTIGFRVGVGVFFVGLGAALRLLSRVRRNDRPDPGRVALVFGALLLCWGASISYGYQTPILGIGLLGAALISLADTALPRWVKAVVAVSAAATVAATVADNLQHPYHDRPRRELTANLGELYPRFGRLLTNHDHYNMYAELKQLSAELATSQGRPFVAMPNFPLIHFLENRTSRVQVDWFHPGVMAGRESMLVDELAAARMVVFMVRDAGGYVENVPACSEVRRNPDALSITDAERIIMRDWHFLRQSRYFCIYQSPG